MPVNKKNKFSSSKIKLIFTFILITFLFCAGFFFALSVSDKILPLFNKEIKKTKVRVVDSKVPLPIVERISGYIQSELVDFDNDGEEEAVVIYHDNGGTTKIYRTYFAIFKLVDNRWVTLVEKELEGFSIWEETESAEEVGEKLNSFMLVELTGSEPKEVLVKTQSEGSGSFLGLFVYGLTEKGIGLLFTQGPVIKGEADIEDNKIWLISPSYQKDDPDCCPSLWVKTWWEWNKDQFIQIGEFENSDFKKVEKAKYSPQQKIQTGFIEGSLIYPSEGIPKDMKVCAENIDTGKEYCTDKHLEDKKYTNGVGYKLEVPEGNYHVYSSTKMLKDYRAYYTQFVTCGLTVGCSSHEKVIVKIMEKQTTDNIDPGDWYQ